MGDWADVGATLVTVDQSRSSPGIEPGTKHSLSIPRTEPTVITVINFMTSNEHRVALVQDVLTQNTKLDEKGLYALAVSVLQALDRIPEKIR